MFHLTDIFEGKLFIYITIQRAAATQADTKLRNLFSDPTGGLGFTPTSDNMSTAVIFANVPKLSELNLVIPLPRIASLVTPGNVSWLTSLPSYPLAKDMTLS